MKKHLLTIALAVVTLTASAQNSAIYKIDEMINNNQLVEAAQLCKEAMANPKTTKFQALYNKAGQVSMMLFTPELIKASQSMPLDTAAFVNNIDLAVQYYTKSYEATQGVDSKGKPVKVDKKIAEDTHFRLINMADFYNYAALFEYKNGNVPAAINYFQKFVDYPKNPALTQADRDSLNTVNKEAYAQTRYNLCRLYFGEKNWDALFANSKEALDDHFNNHDIYVMLENAYLELGDSAMWEKTLLDAATLEGDAGFSEELIGYYYRNHLTDKAVSLANDMTTKNPDNPMSWYIKGLVESDLHSNIDEARKAYLKCLELDPSFYAASINMATTYNNEVIRRSDNHEFDHATRGMYSRDTKEVFMKETRVILDLYLQSAKYLEDARASAPDQPRQWARRLQGAYNNLRRLYENLDDKATAAEYQAKYDELEEICNNM